MTMVQYGIDRVSEFPSLLRDGRVALLTSVTGRSSGNRSTIDLLHEQYHLTALLGPEHGVRGDQPAGVLTGNYIDPHTGLTVFSLYSTAGKRLREEMLDTFDILVCDLQDVGLRFYTFLSTVCYLVEDCARHHKRLVVLDRPTPLGGSVVEGGLLQEAYRSFVGCRCVPVRVAEGIYEKNGAELALLAAATARKLGMDRGKVALLGGQLVHDTLLRAILVAKLAQTAPGLTCVDPEQDAAAGAALMALSEPEPPDAWGAAHAPGREDT